MSNDIKDGGPAFPIPLDDRPGAYEAHPGMTLRDYFAAKAMQALIAEHDFGAEPRDLLVARLAYLMADAMLAARGGA